VDDEVDHQCIAQCGPSKFFLTFHSLQKAEWFVILLGAYRWLQTIKGYSQVHEMAFLQPS